MNGQQLNKLVSVIIPTYNNSKYLPLTIQTVLNQTYHPVEIIVVDDGSIDDTMEVLNPFKDKIYYFYRDNSGSTRARNFGISQARGRYLAFLDADVLWHRDKLTQQIAILEKNSDRGMVCTNYNVFKDISLSETINKINPQKYDFLDLLQKDFIMCSSVVVSRKVINTVGVFNESYPYGEDYELWFRIAQKFQIYYIDQILAQYRIVDKSFTRRADEEKRRYWHVKVIIEALKDANGLISKSQVQKTMAKIYFRYGFIDFIHQQFKSARKCFLKSLSMTSLYNWYNWKTIVYLGLSFFPFLLKGFHRKN